MESKTGREVSVALRVETLTDYPDGPNGAACLRCGTPLDVHQPDAGLPDRMLATCGACRSWYLVDCGTDADAVVMVLLPDPGQFRGGRRG